MQSRLFKFHFCFNNFNFYSSCYGQYHRGGSGQKSFISKRYLAKGGQVSEGVTVLELQSTYFWTPVMKTNFTVGIVVADGEKERMLSSLTIPSGI